MGRSGGGVFNTTAKSGTNSFRGTGFTQLRPGALIGPLFFAKMQGIEDKRAVLARLRRRLRRPDQKGQDVLLGGRRRATATA